MNLTNYIAICDSIILLLEPIIEIVIHDLKTNKIIYINGNLSKRMVGNDSLIDLLALNKQSLNQVLYDKVNFNGKLIKSISTILDNELLMCINIDISLFNQMKNISELFIQTILHKPESLFKNDWQDKLHLTIHEYLQKLNLTLDNLKSLDKKNMIKYLYNMGAFKEKNAAEYIAKIINISRATMFKYLKEVKNK